MVEAQLHRFRIKYTKKPSLRFIGHLDMLRTWERSLRRARIPMAYSQGFHPHQRINMGLALPLGFSSDCEMIDLWLEEDIGVQELRSGISNSLPPGIDLLSIEKTELNSPSLQKLIKMAEYAVTIDEERTGTEVMSAVERLLSQTAFIQERRAKEYDLRPLIKSIEVDERDNGVILRMRLHASQEGTGRPDEVIKALGYKPEKAQIVRTRLILEDG